MPPKNKNKKPATPIESTRHKDKRKNAVPVGLAIDESEFEFLIRRF